MFTDSHSSSGHARWIPLLTELENLFGLGSTTRPPLTGLLFRPSHSEGTAAPSNGAARVACAPGDFFVGRGPKQAVLRREPRGLPGV
jgi:hypothetical protein